MSSQRHVAPTSTYRLQITPDFTLDDAVIHLDRIADLGISHLYLSPLLQAAAGSTHGYDVVDHARIDHARGGEESLRRLASAAHERGIGIVLDIVPNHMSVADARENKAWWDVLTYGRASPYARWFDIDWDAGPILIPVLKADAATRDLTLAAGPDGTELRYGDRRFPVSPGTESGVAQDVHLRQNYRLVGWRHEASDLTYRRFFDVTTLAGLRVEDRAVHDATHELILRLVRDGVVDGLRIDHPDGLADPAEYLNRLRDDTDAAWVVVEKILEPGERLPDRWSCAGTTGYDAARLVNGVFVDPSGEAPLTQLWRRLTGDHTTFRTKVLNAKREVTAGSLAAEVARLARAMPDIDPGAVAEVLAQFPVYRSYLPTAGRAHLDEALSAARAVRPDLEPDFGRLAQRLADPLDPVAIRFQQTSGMVMAKGVEDTAFYRHHVLIALNEVGSDPSRFGVGVAEWHAECSALQQNWPATMTLLSSHDTKRSEDVRARIALLSEIPREWAALVERLEIACESIRGPVSAIDRYLLHQTLVGVGIVDTDRAIAYMQKATKEAKLRTAWVDGDPAYDRAIQTFVSSALAEPSYVRAISAFAARIDTAWNRTLRAQKLLQLTMPGVPDVYQGSERVYLALVDPDNRRAVDWTAANDPKTDLTRHVLRLRRGSPESFSQYLPIDVSSPHALAFARSDGLIVVVSRLALGLERDGWGDATIALPPGEWTETLAARPVTSTRLDALVGDRPGALLVRSGSAASTEAA